MIPGLREVLEDMEILSAPGRSALRQREMIADAEGIRMRLQNVAEMLMIVKEGDSRMMARLDALLHEVHDIAGTIAGLENRHIPDDVELFEIKSLAIFAGSIRDIITGLGVTAVTLPDLSEVKRILDPDGTDTSHFYIFDSYDDRLSELRGALRKANPDSPEAAELFAAQAAVEEEVRKHLGAQLYEHAPQLRKALVAIGELDVLLAAARQALRLQLCRPHIEPEEPILYLNLFNPPLKRRLESKGMEFQPVDIIIEKGVTLITGANMGGKSVTLKSLAIAQAMAQLGFYVPASTATIAPMDEIRLCIGDTQSEQTGLSSFAAEMKAIDEALQSMKEGKNLLLLIDEPARTTNPEEGKALAAAIIEVFGRYASHTVITSHYSGLSARRHWRVKGLSDLCSNTTVTPATLSRMMDYGLQPASDSEPPREALRIAGMLGVDTDITSAARRHINENNTQ